LRVFGAAPGTYGIGLTRAIDENSAVARETLGARYLATASHAYCGAQGEAIATGAFTERVAAADALIHVQDQDEQDILDADAIIDHEGGFAAAAQILGNNAAIYHLESARPGALKVRTMEEQIARWCVQGEQSALDRGQMRHGHRGAAEIAGTIDHLYALAVLTDAVASRHFELLFEATLGTPLVRDFLVNANPKPRVQSSCASRRRLTALLAEPAEFDACLPCLDAGDTRMMSKAPLRKGWCPGARRPMPVKDGLLVRLRISGGIVAGAIMRGIAQAGRDHGNGLFDLSARGNLQIRGVRESALPALIEHSTGLASLMRTWQRKRFATFW